MSFLGYNSRTVLPYAEALLKLPAHIQQLDMEVSVIHGDSIWFNVVLYLFVVH